MIKKIRSEAKETIMKKRKKSKKRSWNLNDNTWIEEMIQAGGRRAEARESGLRPFRQPTAGAARD
jgi:hypothetical protein